MPLNFRDRIGLALQRNASRALIPLTYLLVIAWMRWVRSYRIPELARIRREFRAFRKAHRGPLLICGNHLTAIDSLLIMWALSPAWRCWLRPERMPWNLPDKTNFSGSLPARIGCWVGRCVPIQRLGPREQVQRALSKIERLLGMGDSLLIFPEGGRSRTGRVDTENFSYGVGSLLQKLPEARVLCVFLRGEKQKSYTWVPERDQEFFLELRAVVPSTLQPGLRGARELATQIIGVLAEMEQGYFHHAG